jgi:hypothetical protein
MEHFSELSTKLLHVLNGIPGLMGLNPRIVSIERRASRQAIFHGIDKRPPGRWLAQSAHQP